MTQKAEEMAKDIDVLGIGNAIMDIIAPVPDAFLSAQNIERGSMTLVDEPRALSLNEALDCLLYTSPSPRDRG